MAVVVASLVLVFTKVTLAEPQYIYTIELELYTVEGFHNYPSQSIIFAKFNFHE